MDKASIAILVSLVSVAVAAAALGWNVFRDVTLKARVRVTLKKSRVFHPSFEKPKGPYIDIGVLNLGPGEIKIELICVFNCTIWKKIFKKCEYAFVTHDFTNPLSAQLPLTLKRGERKAILLEFNKDCFLKNKFNKVGVSDSFGRNHWAPKKQLKEIYKQYQKEFQNL